MAGTVFVYGSINTDLVVYCARLPQPGETVSGGTFASFPGGKGANQAVAAQRYGAAVAMHGCLGDDTFGRDRLASLAEAGMSTAGVRVVPGAHSGVAQITVDAVGENTIAVAPGANTLFDGSGITWRVPRPGEVLVSLFQNEVPQDTTETLIENAHDAGHVVIWNLAPTLSRRPSERTLRFVDYLVCNRNELAALTGGTSAEAESGKVIAQARIPLAWGVVNLIVTLGKEGSIWVSPKAAVPVGAFSVDAVDTVGAGDCFCGVFAAALSEGMDVPGALRTAAAAAAISTTRQGAQTSMPMREEVVAFLSRRGG